MTDADHQLIRIVFSALNDVEEWRLGDAALAAARGYPREYPAAVIDDYGILFVDLALDVATGDIVCHEVNGPNAVGSDALTGESSLRAAGEVAQTLRRMLQLGHLREDGVLQRDVVAVHAHQHWKFLRTGGEFYPRVDRYASLLEAALPGVVLQRRGAAEQLGSERVAVVMGDVPDVAASLQVEPRTGRFEYQGRPVVFIGNPNLVPELLRTAKLRRDGGRIVLADLREFHAWRLVSIIHDKVLQQQLLHGTGIRPLRCFAAATTDEALIRTRELLAHGPVVLKPTGASGGAGVQVVVPQMSAAEIRARIAAVLDECQAKYGDNIEAMVLPLTGFEFVQSTGYPMHDGDHLWDLRIAVLFEPGTARVFPVSMRVTPQAFDAAHFHMHRDQWISNVSGRQVTLLKSGMDDVALEAVGMTADRLERCFTACVAWTQKAWDASIRGGGSNGSVYEDDCERLDPQFYPTGKFKAPG